MQIILNIFSGHNSETKMFIQNVDILWDIMKVFPWLGIAKIYSPAFDGHLRNFVAPWTKNLGLILKSLDY